MTMEWNNRNYRFDPNSGNGMVSFEEHNGRMTEFRGSHANVALVINGPRLDEAALLESLRPLQVCRSMIEETGGSALPNDTTDQSPLVPMWKVAHYKLSQN